MEKIKFIRQVDEIGRIVLPYEIRQAMAWGENTPVEIYLNAAGNEVVIKSHTAE